MARHDKTSTPISRRRYDSKDFRIMNRNVDILTKKYQRTVELLEYSVTESERLKKERDTLKLKITKLEDENNASGIQWSAEIESSLGSIIINLDKSKEIDIRLDKLLKKFPQDNETTDIWNLAEVTELSTTDTTTDTITSSPRSALSL